MAQTTNNPYQASNRSQEDLPSKETLDRLSGKTPAQLTAWLRRLTVAVFFVSLTVLCTFGAVMAQLIDFHFGESLLIGGACGGSIAIGFVLGWLSHAAVGRIRE